MPNERWRLGLALATVYLIWGSTYLAILISIETIPPFLMGGVRFVVAGSAMYGWAILRGAPRPTGSQLKTGIMAGILLLGGGNGAVVWSEQFIPSGAAALVVATVPIWIILVDWVRPGGSRPSLRISVGLLAGFVGTAILITPSDLMGGGLDPVAVLVVVGGAISWAAGSVFTRHSKQHPVPTAAVGLNMMAGGVSLLVMATLTGEWSQLDIMAVSGRSAWAFLYLIVFGAVVAFTAYLWLLRNASLATATTYAYVNPVVAVLLGWLFVGEQLTVRMQLATVIIVAAVFVITSGGRARPTRS